MKEDELTVLIGAGAMGLAIARRVSEESSILLADLSQENAEKAAKELEANGLKVSIQLVDVTSRKSVAELAEAAQKMGKPTKLILATGISPSNAPAKVIFKVDLYGAALVLEQFRNIISHGGSALVISSQSSYRLAPLSIEQEKLLATSSSDDLLELDFLNTKEVLNDSLYAYQLSKKGCSLRVRSEAIRWGERGSRVNAISPGIIMTSLAQAELSGPNGDSYREMIRSCPVGRAGTVEEVAAMAAHIMGPEGGFISGSDFLMDGGVSANYWFNKYN